MICAVYLKTVVKLPGNKMWFWTRQHCTSEDQDPLSCMKELNVCP